MANLEKISKIPRDVLSGEHYFQSLLEQAYLAQLLSEPELEQLQLACLALLAKKTERFNGGDSSSIPIETAQDILASLLFTIGVQLKTYPCPDDAVEALRRDGVEAVWTDGRRQIDRLLNRARMRHSALTRHLLPTKNMFYSATIVDGIRGFFKLYYPDFAAQEIHITADYPVYNKTERLQGIEFIVQYLKQLAFENQFCVRFSAQDVHHLLCGYDARYEELLFNLYEPVLAAALGCVLTGRDADKLDLTPEAQSSLCALFAGKSRMEIEGILTGALETLAHRLSLPNDLHAYSTDSLPLLAAAIELAEKGGQLNRVFLVPRHPQQAPTLTVSGGERMDDATYRKVLEEFMDSHTLENQMEIIREHIHSLEDLNDLLLDAERTAEEVATLLVACTPAEIAALMKKYTALYEMSFTELRDCEQALCEGLNLFVSSLPPKEQALLQQAAALLEVD